MRNAVLLPLLIVLTSCASYTAKKKAANKCHIDIDTYYLKELSIEQLECIQTAGKEDPDFSSLEERIEKKKRELKIQTEQKEQEQKLTQPQGPSSAKIISTTMTPLIGATLRAEGDVPRKVIEDVMFDFCTKNKLPYYKVLETKLGKTTGENPQVYSDITFECVKEVKKRVL